MRALLLFSAVSIAVIASCSPPANTTTAGSETSTSAAASTPAPGDQIRTGRWRKVTTVMGQTQTEYECITTADLNRLASEPNSNCSSANGFQRTAEGLVYEGTCTGEDGGGTIRTVMTGDLQNNYTVDSTMRGAGAASSMQIQMHIVGTYDGACHGDE